MIQDTVWDQVLMDSEVFHHQVLVSSADLLLLQELL